MVLKTNPITRHIPCAKYASDDATCLLFGREPLHQRVRTRRQHKLSRGCRVGKSIGFLRVRRGPSYPTLSQMSWVNERDGALDRLLPQMLSSTKVNHSASRHFHAKLPQGSR